MSNLREMGRNSRPSTQETAGLASAMGMMGAGVGAVMPTAEEMQKTIERQVEEQKIMQKVRLAVMDRVIFYKGDDSKWRWKRTAPNNEIVGASSEGYNNFQDCKDNLERQRTDFVLDCE